MLRKTSSNESKGEKYEFLKSFTGIESLILPQTGIFSPPRKEKAPRKGPHPKFFTSEPRQEQKAVRSVLCLKDSYSQDSLLRSPINISQK